MRLIILVCAFLLMSPAPLRQGSPEAVFKQRVSKFRNSKRFEYYYDKFKDQARFSVGPFNIGGDSAYVFGGSMLGLTAYTFADGKDIKNPDRFILLFDSSSKDWLYLRDCGLNLIVDGERVDLGQCTRQSDIRRGGVTERLFFKLTPEQFTKIANAKVVELRIGRTELKLKDEHLQAFKDLISLTTP